MMKINKLLTIQISSHYYMNYLCVNFVIISKYIINTQWDIRNETIKLWNKIIVDGWGNYFGSQFEQ